MEKKIEIPSRLVGLKDWGLVQGMDKKANGNFCMIGDCAGTTMRIHSFIPC